MRHTFIARPLLLGTFVGLVLAAGTARAADEAVQTGQEHPLASGKLSLRDGGKGHGHVLFRGRWQSSAAMGNPLYDGSTLRISGQGPTDGDSGLIRLDPSRWFR